MKKDIIDLSVIHVQMNPGTQTKELGGVKMNQVEEITKEDFIHLLKDTEHWYDVLNLLDGLTGDPFPVIQNPRYYIEKIGKRGQISDYAMDGSVIKANVGIFRVTMTYDYKHPNNFAQNKYNVVADFDITI